MFISCCRVGYVAGGGYPAARVLGRRSSPEHSFRNLGGFDNLCGVLLAIAANATAGTHAPHKGGEDSRKIGLIAAIAMKASGNRMHMFGDGPSVQGGKRSSSPGSGPKQAR